MAYVAFIVHVEVNLPLNENPPGIHYNDGDVQNECDCGLCHVSPHESFVHSRKQKFLHSSEVDSNMKYDSFWRSHSLQNVSWHSTHSESRWDEIKAGATITGLTPFLLASSKKKTHRSNSMQARSGMGPNQGSLMWSSNQSNACWCVSSDMIVEAAVE